MEDEEEITRYTENQSRLYELEEYKKDEFSKEVQFVDYDKEKQKVLNSLNENVVKANDGDLLNNNDAEELEKQEHLKGYEPKPVKNEIVEDSNISTALLKEYGNNIFSLSTYDPSVNLGKNNGKLELYGVLKQLPQFSMSQNAWTAGPAGSITDIVQNYLCGDKLEKLTVLGGTDRSFNAIDETADRVYSGTSNVGFNLSFRVYSTQTIGSRQLTSWQNWIKVLALFAQPSIASKMNIAAMGNNIVNGVLQGFDNVKDILETMGNAFMDSENKLSREGFVNALGNTIEQTMNKASILVTSRDDENRVSGNQNQRNFYGAKLWKLRILPGLIQRPVIVLIDSWSVTFSKERNLDNNQPIYIDFTINCKLDQVPNAGTWMYYLDSRNNRSGYFYDISKFTPEQKQLREKLGGVAKPNTEYTWEDVQVLDIPKPEKKFLEDKTINVYYEWQKVSSLNSNAYKLVEIEY